MVARRTLAAMQVWEDEAVDFAKDDQEFAMAIGQLTRAISMDGLDGKEQAQPLLSRAISMDAAFHNLKKASGQRHQAEINKLARAISTDGFEDLRKMAEGRLHTLRRTGPESCQNAKVKKQASETQCSGEEHDGDEIVEPVVEKTRSTTTCDAIAIDIDLVESNHRQRAGLHEYIKLLFGLVSLASIALISCYLPWSILLGMYAGLEACFFAWIRLVRNDLRRQKSLDERLQPPGGSRLLTERSMECVSECAAWESGRTAEEWISGWFRGTPYTELRRDNVREFFAWAFFTKHLEELDASEGEEIEASIEEHERRFGWNLPEGYNPEARPIRLNFDEMEPLCHPLLYYLCIAAVRALARVILHWLGFVRHAQRAGQGFAYFHYVPPAAAAASSKPPVVLIHGVGIGLFPYLNFAWRLATAPSSEMFLLDLAEVGQAGVRDVLPPSELADAVAAMLVAHGHRRARFVAHSYGTFVLSWIARERPDVVAKAVFLDPVCFHLVQPDVAVNFMYRRPDSLFSVLLASFIRWELFTQNVMMRNFYWQHNVMWREELPEGSVVFLSGKDDIVNSAFVRQYLEQVQPQLLFFDDFVHGALLFSRRAQEQVIELM